MMAHEKNETFGEDMSLLHTDSLMIQNLQGTKNFFSPLLKESIIPSTNESSEQLSRKSRLMDEYAFVLTSEVKKEPIVGPIRSNSDHQSALMMYEKTESFGNQLPLPPSSTGSRALVRRTQARLPKPVWHAPWKLMRVISGHTGWVRSISVDVSNEWFATGSADRTIKIWDLASGTLKVSLTGHISAVRGLQISDRHPYLFSAGEDKMVKCWDLEVNKVIRHYHGHLSGVYCLALHPTLDLLVTAGRDAVARVWDMRTKQSIFVLGGHSSTISDVKCQGASPQIISSSMDSTIRLWDLAAGKTMSVLTHHKKSIRCLALHPKEFTFASGSPDNIKKFKFPEGQFLHNFSGHNSIINTISVNEDNVLFSGGDNGSIAFWDWKSGVPFQKTESLPQPGSLDSEAGIFASTFDRTGLRLITCEADKSIKVWKEDENASE